MYSLRQICYIYSIISIKFEKCFKEWLIWYVLIKSKTQKLFEYIEGYFEKDNRFSIVC